MDLSKISSKDLRKEIERREMISHFEKWNTLPDSFIKYKTIRNVLIHESCSYYIANIEDGCEGFTVMVQSFQEIGYEELIETVKHHVLTKAIEDGYFDDIDTDSWHIQGIEVYQIGRYSFDCIRLLNEQ